jgi:hypothetical protein
MPKKKSVRKTRKKVKFSTISIKVTAQQRRSLLNFCRSRHTTPNKLIKKSIRPFLENYADLEVEIKKKEKVNQLQLF